MYAIRSYYAFSAPGTYPVSLKVTDDLGWSATFSDSVTTAATRAPIADAGGAYLVDEGQTLFLDGIASVHPDAACGNTLTYLWDLDNDA